MSLVLFVLQVGSKAKRFPELIESFKVEHVDVPVQRGTHTLGPEGLGMVRTGFSGSVIRSAIARPSRFANPQFNGTCGASNGLDVAKSLLQVIQVRRRSIADCLALPIAESVDEP